MGMIFNAEEIFDIAVQIEKNGNLFYTRAAEKTENEGLKERFVMLADMELEHVQTFSDLKEDQVAAGTDAYPGADEARAYLRAFSRGHVFSLLEDVEKLIRGLDSGEQILKTAIGAERDSIAFYSGMKKLVPDTAGRNKIEHIIAEEMGHVALLSNELEAVNRKQQ